MKHRNARVLSLLLAVVCLCGLFTGCTAKPQEANEEAKYDYLVLVNKQSKLPDDWESVVVLEDAQNTLPEDIALNEDNDYLATDVFKVETKALEAFRALQEDCAKDGITILLDSTYRSVARQQELWAEFAEEYGEDYCKKYVAVPGYSEHHTGLAIDICVIKDGRIINDNDEMIAERELFAKIHEKLADHGFILRYPEGRDDSTGYSYEPWHFRYVGSAEIAKEIMERGLTLEEYLTLSTQAQNPNK
ncbi:MAG: M15 family metallopeptidase [Clostridia bacterium]|nr:M15 family metallopeptidase [Clostridia bacterium]